MRSTFPVEVWRLGPVVLTDTVLVSFGISITLVVAGLILLRIGRTRRALEILYDLLDQTVVTMVHADVRGLVPLILTQWIFITAANLAGLIPMVGSPTRDLSLTLALAVVALLAGHAYGLRTRGLAYLRSYIEPHWLLLPFNIIGEVTRTLALALRLFGNMMSGHLVLAIAILVAGLLVPVPLMLLAVLTSVVQAYIFGVLTLAFIAGSMEAGTTPRKSRRRRRAPPGPAEGGRA